VRSLAAVLLALAVAGSAAACAGPAGTSSPSAVASEAPSDSGAESSETPAVVIPTSPVAGIVIAVDSAGLDQVKGFTLRTNDGSSVVFTLGTLENGDEFPPGHLKEHQAAASPVLVFFRQENGQLVVFRIEDAG
jgi:hypothetical protein